MTSLNYGFPKNLGSGDDPIIGLIEAVNEQSPGFIEWVIDGGAGVGSFTGRVLGGTTGCKVIAYEPLPENAKVLRSRFNGVSAVDIREAALGDQTTSVSFEVPERRGIPDSLWAPGTSYGGFVSRSGILAKAKGIAKKLLRRGVRSRPYEKISVRMVRLDSDLDVCPDFIKLDLQGGEPEALNGLGSRLAQVKIMKIEIEMLSGDARRRCVQLLNNAGFFLLVEDFQFLVPHVTDRLRRALTDIGIEIELEDRILPSDPSVLVKGKWPSGRPLPMQNIELTKDFADVLSASKASFFAIDLIALNGRYVQHWNSLLGPEVLEQSGMKLNDV